MEFQAETRALSQVDTDVLVVGIFQDENINDVLRQLDNSFLESLSADIDSHCQRETFSGKAGQTVHLPTYGAIAAHSLLLRGLGKSSDYSASVLRKTTGSIAKRLSASGKVKTVALEARVGNNVEFVQAAIEGWLLGSYSFLKYKTQQADDIKKAPAELVSIVASTIDGKQFDGAMRRGTAIALATNFARELIAEPAAYMTPSRLAATAQALSQTNAMQCEVLDQADAQKLGMGSFLGVAKGAKEPARFIILRYTHPNAEKTVGIAGKGITFDSGGLSIKSAVGMEHMKYDMAGAAAVIGTMKVLNELQPQINVIAVAVATENMPGSAAMHPGDILTAMNGKTIEVNNTDAEGRLVLADALCFLTKEPTDEIIDIATLTGAVVTALGRTAAGIMSNNDAFAKRIIESGAAAGEKYWQLPLFDEYKESLKSDIADLKNAGSKGEASSSSAAMFLMEFVDNRPWAHLDIAGPGWLDKEKDELNKGGTAFGVRTLCYYILSQARQP